MKSFQTHLNNEAELDALVEEHLLSEATSQLSLAPSVSKVIFGYSGTVNYGGIDKNGIPKVIELSMLNSKKIKINRILSKRKYPIIDLDYKNFKRREDIKIEFNK